MPLGAVETTTSRISCSAKAGAVSIWRSSGGMSPRGTCCWPVVATTSPAVSGFIPKLRFSAWAEPCRRRFFCAGAKTTAGAGREFGLADLDEVARADLGIGALQAVETDDLQPLVLGIGADRAGRGGALADQLDHVALGEAHFGHHRARQPGDAAAAVLGAHGRDLQPPRLCVRRRPSARLSCGERPR